MNEPHNHRGFYIDQVSCVTCGICDAIAPDIFVEDESVWRVQQQPQTIDEIDKTVEAAWSCITSCIRYSGQDEALIKRLAEAGLAESVDNSAAQKYEMKPRKYIRFSLDKIYSTAELAAMFTQYLRTQDVTVLPKLMNSSKVRLSWYRWYFKTLIFCIDKNNEYFIELRSMTANIGLGWKVEEWLSEIGASHIRFLTRDDFKNGSEGLHRPI